MVKDLTLIQKLQDIVEQTAIAASKLRGKGLSMDADRAAVVTMRKLLNNLSCKIVVATGEGERDKAPMLFVGESLGNELSDNEFCIAVDPLEGTTLAAEYRPGSLVVLAVAKKDGLLSVPDLYMEKLVFHKDIPKDLLHISNTVEDNLTKLAKYNNCAVSDINLITLQRDRHSDIINSARKLGVNVRLIDDGDIMAALSVTGICAYKSDIYIGTGGAPEGVIAAAALSYFGANMQAKLLFKNQSDIDRAKKYGITDCDKIYQLQDLSSCDVAFIAAGVTDGELVKGVRDLGSTIEVSSLIINSALKKITRSENIHKIDI